MKRKTTNWVRAAESSNPETWNCLCELTFHKSSMTFELDQFAECGFGKDSLYQIGSGELITDNFKYLIILN
ncbi:MAG: hypothetical protein IT276_14935 [Ignavibacteriaceae bacterium]|nr:hypothetical protein [Ignavibacteriaceae bacterium]